MRDNNHLLPLLIAIVLLCAALYLLLPSGPFGDLLALNWDDEPADEPKEDPSDPTEDPTQGSPERPEDPAKDPNEPTEPEYPIKDPSVVVTPSDDPPTDDPPAEQPSYNYAIDITAYLPYINTQYDNILLVNKSTPLDKDFIPADLVTLPTMWTGGKTDLQLDATAATALEAMLLCMRADGISDVCVTSAYRDYNYQADLQDRYLRAEMQNDPTLTRAEALSKVHAYSAPPGMSEHQSGLCVDFFVPSCMKELENYGYEGKYADVGFAETQAFIWLQQNAHEFGFILRYPADKVDLTQYSYESWHYRFVGREVAVAIARTGLTLEEYLGK